MKKSLSYLSIAIIAIAVFSCVNKKELTSENEWNPENEADFKKEMKKNLLSEGEEVYSDEQANYVADCLFEKIKSKGIKPNDSETSKTTIMAIHFGEECADEALSNTKINPWSPVLESECKKMLKSVFLDSGFGNSEALLLAQCAFTKIKEQNIRPTDFTNSKNTDLIEKIIKSCEAEMRKKE